MGEQLFAVCECDELPTEDVLGRVPVEDCLDNSKCEMLFPCDVGIPSRSENGWPKESQSFSTSACIEEPKTIKVSLITVTRQYHNLQIRIFYK